MGKTLPSDFEWIRPIGKGGYGKVWKVKHNKTQKLYALKQMNKARILSKKSIKNVNSENKFLQQLYHKHIVNVRKAF